MEKMTSRQIELTEQLNELANKRQELYENELRIRGKLDKVIIETYFIQAKAENIRKELWYNLNHQIPKELGDE